MPSATCSKSFSSCRVNNGLVQLGIVLLGTFLASILMLSNILPSYAVGINEEGVKNADAAKAVKAKDVAVKQAGAAKKEATPGHKSIEEKKGPNAVNVKLAISKLKDELKSNPKALTLLKTLEDEVGKYIGETEKNIAR